MGRRRRYVLARHLRDRYHNVRFPFVPRGVYEESVEHYRIMLADERARTDYLTRLVADMKVAGGTVVPGASAPRPSRAANPAMDKVLAVIDANPLVQDDPTLRSHLIRTAEERLARNADIDDLVTEMATWYVPTISTEDED